MLRSYRHVIILVLVFSALLQSCKPKDKVAPGFPPKESLNVDLSFFDQAASPATNFEFAQLSVQKWTDYLNDSLDFYRQIFDQVLERNLEFQTNDTWLINFEKELNEINYTVNYFETVDTDTVVLKLFVSYNKKSPITGDDSLSEVLLMEGNMTNYEYGDWTINLIDTGFNNALEFLRIDWALKANKNPEIKFTNSLIGGENGNRLHYKDSIQNSFTSYLDLYHNADINYTFIQWNSSSNIGRVKDNFQFGDENWYCWDESLSDQVCSKN